MELMEYTKTYQEYKQELDAVLTRTAEDFVQIGYLLKVSRDTNILAESGYATVTDFAKAEYGIDKTQVSRFISINDRFSEDGYSDHLLTSYKGFGYAKLTLMLQIPDEINEVLPPTLSKAEIQDIKDEVDAESKVTDIEVEIEKVEAAAVTDKPMLPPEGSPLERNLWQLGKEQEDLFRKLWMVCFMETASGNRNNAEIIDVLIPQGDAVYTVRIPGERRTQIIVNSDGATIVNLKTLERSKYTEDQICLAVRSLVDGGSSPEEQYKMLYGEDLTPEEPEIAPVQQEKPVQRKEKKVQKAKIEKPKPQSVEENTEEEQIPGQDSVLNHPEYLPENGNNKADSTENVQETDTFVDKQQEKPPYFEKVSAEKEKTEPEMPTNAINTECEDEVDALGNYMNCWEAICDAHRKITLFIEDYSAYDTTPDNMRIEAARINAVTLATELEHLKTL